jgi:AraC-like DNA-binding protein
MIDTALDQILAALAVDVKAFAICEFASDSGVAIRPLDEIEIHFVLAGTMYLTLGEGAPIAAGPGSVVLVPPRVGQIMGASPSPSRLLGPADICGMRPDGLLSFDAREGAPGTVLVACGKITADVGGSFGPFDGLAGPICCDLSEASLIRVAFAEILREIDRTALGSRALVGALMKACVVKALRRHADDHGTRQALPGLFEKPSLARALACVVETPSAGHNLHDLARMAGMSRSKFAKVFAETIGLPPMEFVARVRLARARELLMTTDLPVAVVAARVGFASRSHFSRSFRNSFGVDPSGMRRDAAIGDLADA